MESLVSPRQIPYFDIWVLVIDPAVELLPDHSTTANTVNSTAC